MNSRVLNRLIDLSAYPKRRVVSLRRHRWRWRCSTCRSGDGSIGADASPPASGDGGNGGNAAAGGDASASATTPASSMAYAIASASGGTGGGGAEGGLANGQGGLAQMVAMPKERPRLTSTLQVQPTPALPTVAARAARLLATFSRMISSPIKAVSTLVGTAVPSLIPWRAPLA